MKKIIKISVVFIVIIAILAGMYFYIQYSNGINLTQLSNQSSRQMMGYTIETKDKDLIVIDGGTEEDSENLKKYIDKNNKIVNYWFITHPHDDHIGAMVKLLEENAIKIENIVYSLNEIEWYKKYDNTRIDIVERLLKAIEKHKEINVVEANTEDVIEISNIKVEILGVKNPEITENAGNNQSMVFKVLINDKSILFLGDTGKELSEKLIKDKKEKLKSYAVQMSHHGQAGATKEFYNIVSPQICLWPTPDWLWDNNANNQGYNTGNWKTLETRQWIKELNVKTNYIEKDGDITIKIW